MAESRDVEIVTIEIDDSSDEEEKNKPIDFTNCDWMMTSDITVEKVTESSDSPFVPVDVPNKVNFFWNGLNPRTDQLLVNSRKRPPHRDWMCGLCYHWVKTKEELQEHMSSDHIGTARFHVCALCGSRFAAKFLLQRHEETHKYKPSLPYSQYVDSSGLPDTSRIDNHYLKGCRPALPSRDTIVEAGAIFKRIANAKSSCTTCHLVFANMTQLQEHYANTHASMYCKRCPKNHPPRVFELLEDLKAHLIVCHDLKFLEYYYGPYSQLWKTVDAELTFRKPGVAVKFVKRYHNYCKRLPPITPPLVINLTEDEETVCNNEINLQDLLVVKPIESTKIIIHKKPKNSPRPVPPQTNGHIPAGAGPRRKCFICKSLVPSKTYDEHLKGHPELKFKCEESGCKKRFRTQQSLDMHQRAHSNERMYVCHLCPRGYNYSSLLKRHLRTHTGETPYSCYCGLKFHDSVSFKYHQMKVHTGERPHKCDICNKGFILANDLKKHVASQHHRQDTNGLSSVSDSALSPESKSDSALDEEDPADDMDLDVDIVEMALNAAGESVMIGKQVYRDQSSGKQ